MKSVAATTVLLSLGFALPAHALTAKFSWSGTSRCTNESPPFFITGAPEATRQLRFLMRDADMPSFNHGGSTVAYPDTGKVPMGAIAYIGPCPPEDETHRYVWTIDALDASGNVLATTQVEGNFPEPSC